MIRYLSQNAFRYWAYLFEYFVTGIVGLSVGMALFYFMALFTLKETSYDEWVQHESLIYRLETTRQFPQTAQEITNSAPLVLTPFLEEKLTGLSFIGVGIKREIKFQIGDLYSPAKLLFVNRDFDNIFPLETISGDLKAALANPLSLVLVKTAAFKLFGTQPALGKIIKVGPHALKIGAIVEDWPKNSHIEFEALTNLKSPLLVDRRAYLDNWGSLGAGVYLKFKGSIEKDELENEINQILSVNAPIQYGGYDVAAPDSAPEYRLRLTPLRDLYLSGEGSGSLGPVGSKALVFFVLMTMCILVIITTVNFALLVSSFWSRRSSEVLLRQLSGASTWDICKMILVENVLWVSIAMPFSVALVYFFYDLVAAFFTYRVEGAGEMMSAGLYTILVLVILVLSASVLPINRVMGSRSPIDIIYRRDLGTTLYLVLSFQLIVLFTLTFLLMAVSARATNLVEFDLGFNQSDLEIIWDLPTSPPAGNSSLIAERIKMLKGVESVAQLSVVPGDGAFNARSVSLENGTFIPSVQLISIDAGTLQTLGVAPRSGRNFKRHSIADEYRSNLLESNALINREAARAFGYSDDEQTIGKYINMGETKLRIIGVVPDLYYRSPLRPIDPTVFINDPSSFSKMLVRFSTVEITSSKQAIQDVWNQVYGNKFFSSNSVTEQIEYSYRSIFSQKKILKYAFIIFALLSLVGIFGISSLCVDVRRKEILVRKLLGNPMVVTAATVFRPLGVSFLVGFFSAIALTSIIANTWYSVLPSGLELDLITYGKVAILVFSLLGISMAAHVTRVARTNPIELVRHI